MDSSEICKRLSLDPDSVLNIYPYGSKVYGTATEKSDDDFIIVMTDEGFSKRFDLGPDLTAFSSGISVNDVDGSLYSKSLFEVAILEHEISVLECLWLPPKTVKQHRHDFAPSFILDLPTLRESLSSKASNSFVKAKKKFTVEKDRNPYLARKSLFHSLRILKFGMQIASCGFIHDYRAANAIWESIKDYPSEDWEDYKTTYQPLYNELKTAFRELAPK